MARAGRKDRGLMIKTDAAGKVCWYVRLWHEGKERRFGSFPTKTKAREFYEKAKLDQKEGRFFPERYQRGGYELVESTFDHYLLTITTKKDQRTERYFARWWGEYLRGQRLNAMTPAILDEARQGLLKQGLTPQRVNRYLAWLRHVLNLAVRDGKLHANPVNKLKMYKEPKGKTRFLTVEEEETKLNPALGPTYTGWARLAILTGLRQNEQFRMRWTDVDLERGLITLPSTKAGDCQYVYLNEEAKAILRSMTSWERSPWVFPSENLATPMDARNFYGRVWMLAVKRAGIEWVTWHDLRHTFASRLAMNGVPEHTIAALLRHSSTALVRRYAHLSPSHLKAAVEGVASFGKMKTEAGAIEKQQDVAQPQLIPTVTKTGIEVGSGTAEDAEVMEKIGAPDTN